MISSYRVGMRIERPDDTTEADGQDFIDFWGHALRSDMFNGFNGYELGHGPYAGPRMARWFQDAWSSAGARERRFSIEWFVVQFFDQPGQQGRQVAEINVLTGESWESP